MPSFRDAFPSKWLKAEDCHPPLILTIKSVGLEDIGSGSDVKRKLVLRFYETDKGFVLNVTNGNLIAALFGTDDYDEWVGSRICLGSTKVQFKDKLVDAIRVQPVPTRKPRPVAAPSAPAPTKTPAAVASKTAAPAPAPAGDDDIIDDSLPDDDDTMPDTDVGF